MVAHLFSRIILLQVVIVSSLNSVVCAVCARAFNVCVHTLINERQTSVLFTLCCIVLSVPAIFCGIAHEVYKAQWYSVLNYLLSLCPLGTAFKAVILLIFPLATRSDKCFTLSPHL